MRDVRATSPAMRAAAISALLLPAGCGGGIGAATTIDLSRPGTPEQACVQAVRVNGGRGTPDVLSSQRTGAGAVVLVRSDEGTIWRCSAVGSVVTGLAVT